MQLFRTILIFMVVILLMAGIIPMAIIAGALNLFGCRKAMAIFIYRIGQFWARLLIKLTGCTLTVTGQENIPRTGGFCIVSNHGSIFDILVHLAYVDRPFGFIAKKELLLIPFLNIWIFLLGGLFIDRKNIRNAVRTINRGVEHIKAGGAMIIFPEGHRSRDQGLLPFHPGSLKLATQAASLIIPAAIAGSYGVYERTRRIQAVPVKLTYGVPINTAEIPVADKKQVLADRIRAVIEAAL
ncbi:1-acyl-sn-glycerol-3-phosphate acyltransferase [Spirochaetia bacterium]|nr:1-acyl-sn-glycerol-3-phosphate acyltransferase [Spirochaetia bacterium]